MPLNSSLAVTIFSITITSIASFKFLDFYALDHIVIQQSSLTESNLGFAECYYSALREYHNDCKATFVNVITDTRDYCSVFPIAFGTKYVYTNFSHVLRVQPLDRQHLLVGWTDSNDKQKSNFEFSFKIIKFPECKSYDGSVELAGFKKEKLEFLRIVPYANEFDIVYVVDLEVRFLRVNKRNVKNIEGPTVWFQVTNNTRRLEIVPIRTISPVKGHLIIEKMENNPIPDYGEKGTVSFSIVTQKGTLQSN